MFSKVIFAGVLFSGIAVCDNSQMGRNSTTDFPPNIDSIFKKVEDEVWKNHEKYDEANKKVFDKYEKQLQSELNKLTKAGKLEEAMLLKTELDSFRENVTQKVDNSKKTTNQKLKNEWVLSKKITCDSGYYTFEKNKEEWYWFDNKKNTSWGGKYTLDGNKIVIDRGGELCAIELETVTNNTVKVTSPNTFKIFNIKL